jgi:large subunit ribosomal protein L24
MAAKVKKGDRVIVLTGRDKGKVGQVTEVRPTENRCIVQGVNMVTRHQRPGQGDPGGIKRFEAPIHVSNVALVDPRDGKPTRVGFKTDENGRKFRYAKRSGESIDA